MKKKKANAATQTGLRPLDLIDASEYEQPEFKITGLLEKVAVERTTTYRTWTASRSQGLIGREAKSQECRLGLEIIILGGRVLRSGVTATTV